MQFCPRQLYCSKFPPILVTIVSKRSNRFSSCPGFERDLSQRKIRWILTVQLVMLIDESGKGSRQLIGFATQEYLQMARVFTNNKDIYR